MSDDTGITSIQKRNAGTEHAIEVKGVVRGQERSFVIDVPTFEREAAKGQQHLQEALKDTLRKLHDRD